MTRRWLSCVLVLLAGCGAPPEAAEQQMATSEEALRFGVDRQARLLTWNLYVGMDPVPIFLVPREQLPAAVSAAHARMQATDFALRAQAIALEIARLQPHVIGLQEVPLIRTQSPGDWFQGNPQPATTVELDHLAVLMAALAAQGLDYGIAAVVQAADVELPDAQGNDLRLTDREVLLTRGDVVFADPQQRTYRHNLVVPAGGLGGPLVTIRRGWVAADVRIEGRWFRVASTHLEPALLERVGAVQVAQAAELLAELEHEPLPVFLMGDFNSEADGSTTGTYGLVRASGYLDAWRLAREPDGDTCCQAPALDNETSLLDQRIDFVFSRAKKPLTLAWFLGGVDAQLAGADADDRIGGLWPSDHAGVAASYWLPARRD